MDILTLPLILIVLWGLQAPPHGFYRDGLSLEKTKAIRGLLSLLVIMHHLYLFSQSGFLYAIYDQLGLLCVTLFFFLSGYGLEKSTRNKPGYVKKILTKRIPSILIPYLVFTGIYWIGSFIMGAGYSVQDVFSGFVNGMPVATYSWYIHCLLVMYPVFALAHSLFARRFWAKLSILLIFAVVWTWLCRALGYGHYWYNTVIALPAGVFWAEAEKQLRPKMEQGYWWIMAGSAAAFSAAMVAALVTAGDQILVSLFWLAMCLFILVVYLLLMKLSVKNRLLIWLGDISFEIYGIHGFFLYIYRSEACYLSSDLIWALSVFLSSVIAGWLLHRVFQLCRILT